MWSMHILTHHANIIGNIWASNREINQFPNEMMVLTDIEKGINVLAIKFNHGLHRGINKFHAQQTNLR